MDNYNDLLIKLEKARQYIPKTYVLLGQTRTAIESLQTTITELRDEVERLESLYSESVKDRAWLHVEVERHRDALTKASLHFNTKYGQAQCWHDALAYINQLVKPTEKDDE